MKNWMNKYQEGGEPKPMSWTEYLDSLGITDPKLRSIDPKTKLYSNETHELGKGSDLSYDNYMNAAMERPHTSNVFEDADNLKAGRVIDMYNALFWNREKQDYSGSDRNKYDNELPSNKVDIELSPYVDHSMDKKDALAYIKKLYNTPAEDIISESFDKEAPGYYSRAFKDIPIEYTRSFPRTDLTMYNNPNWERDNPLFSRDKSIEVFGQYDSMPLAQNFYEDWTYNDPKAFSKDKQSLEFQAFPKPTYNYVNVPKRYDEKGNEVVSKYDIPNPQANTYYDFSGSLTEDIYNQKNMLHNIYKQNVENLKKFDPNASLEPSDRDLRREYIEKEYASDPYLFYGDQNTEDRYCVHCERLSGSEHTQSGNIDFFKFKPQYPSSKEWIQSQKPRVDREIIQVRNTPNPTHRTWSKAVQDKNPGMGTHEYATTVRIGTDMYPVTHTTDKPYGEFEVDGKKQYITYEKSPEGGYSPVISETEPARRKVVTPITFKSGGWLDTYDTMTPAWSKNPEGNWVVKAQNGLQYIDEPTRADSLELLKNSRMVLDYYNSRGYDVAPPIYLKNEADKKDIQEATERARKYFDPNTGRRTPAGLDEKVPLSDYYKKKDKNKYYQREYANAILDTRSPMALYDKRILPTVARGYLNEIPGDAMEGDAVAVSLYDPLSITPWDMLTDKQKKLRVKRFGRDGVPESYDPNEETRPVNKYENLKPLPMKLLPLQGPEDRLVKEYNVLVPNEKYRKVYDQSPYSTKEYGPEGKFTHWAKEDEKLSGVWRPIKGTPSDLFVSKRVKYQDGGWLDKYQDAGEVDRDKGLFTYANNPSYFDNRALYHDNPQYNDLIRSKVYAGTHGFNPTTGELVKLSKPVSVPKTTQVMATKDYTKMPKAERAKAVYDVQTPAEREEAAVQAERARRKDIAEDMSKAVQNPYFRGAIPAMMLPGLPALGEAVHAGIMSTPIGAATAGAIGSEIAPGLTYGTLGQGLIDSYFAGKAPYQLAEANTNFKSGDVTEGIVNTALGTMNLLPFLNYIPKRAPGPLMILDDASKGVNRAKGDEPHLTEWQKLRIAEGKPVYTGSGQQGNMTMGEMSAKKQLNKSIDAREKPKKVKKLTKEQEYEKLLRESYYKKGGVKSSAEGYYDYINGYSGIFAKGGTKGWLDNYK